MELSPVIIEPIVVPTKGKPFGIRAGAYVIDAIILYLIQVAVSYVIGFIVGIGFYIIYGREFLINQQLSSQCSSLIMGFILNTLYFAFFEWLFGATLGKVLLGMRVVKENGTPCDVKAAFIRSFARYVDAFFFALPAITSMKPPLQQRNGDKWAHTLVVGSKDLTIQPLRAWWRFFAATGIYLVLNSFVVFIYVMLIIE